MPREKYRILAELPAIVGNRKTHDWILGGTAVASLLSVVTTFANTSAATDPIRPAPQSILVKVVPPHPLTAEGADTPYSREGHVRAGDSISSLVRRLGIDDPDADAFIRSDNKARALQSRLRAGQPVSIDFDAGGDLRRLVYPIPGSDKAITIGRNESGFFASEEPLPLHTMTISRSGVIRTSLFAAADEIGLPDAVAIQLAEIFGGEVDFHTDLRKGDRFAVIYESFTYNGRELKTGRVVAAEFVNAGVTHRAIWFQDSTGGGYYTPEGRSLKPAFLRSPLEFSRVTSGFSMRLHPIHGDWRAHKGVDYAAPMGTSVRATS